ncbi:hypothetical protein FAGKG844_30255 [Frankia sp. AgKG'84/4]
MPGQRPSPPEPDDVPVRRTPSGRHCVYTTTLTSRHWQIYGGITGWIVDVTKIAAWPIHGKIRAGQTYSVNGRSDRTRPPNATDAT